MTTITESSVPLGQIISLARAPAKKQASPKSRAAATISLQKTAQPLSFGAAHWLGLRPGAFITTSYQRAVLTQIRGHTHVLVTMFTSLFVKMNIRSRHASIGFLLKVCQRAPRGLKHSFASHLVAVSPSHT